MTNKEALICALRHYIIFNGGTQYDADKKVASAERCLEYLENGGAATLEWIESQYITLSRVVALRRKSLKGKPNLLLTEDERQEILAEKKQLAGIATLFEHLPELPL